jgi:hypothetical protein
VRKGSRSQGNGVEIRARKIRAGQDQTCRDYDCFHKEVFLLSTDVWGGWVVLGMAACEIKANYNLMEVCSFIQFQSMSVVVVDLREIGVGTAVVALFQRCTSEWPSAKAKPQPLL